MVTFVKGRRKATISHVAHYLLIANNTNRNIVSSSESENDDSAAARMSNYNNTTKTNTVYFLPIKFQLYKKKQFDNIKTVFVCFFKKNMKI